MFLCYKSQITGLTTTKNNNNKSTKVCDHHKQKLLGRKSIHIGLPKRGNETLLLCKIKGDDCRMTLHKARETTLSILKPAENLVDVFPTLGHSEAMMAGRVLEAGLLPVVTFSLTLSPFFLTPVCASGTCHDLVLPSIGLILL